MLPDVSVVHLRRPSTMCFNMVIWSASECEGGCATRMKWMSHYIATKATFELVYYPWVCLVLACWMEPQLSVERELWVVCNEVADEWHIWAESVGSHLNQDFATFEEMVHLVSIWKGCGGDDDRMTECNFTTSPFWLHVQLCCFPSCRSAWNDEKAIAMRRSSNVAELNLPSRAMRSSSVSPCLWLGSVSLTVSRKSRRKQGGNEDWRGGLKPV